MGLSSPIMVRFIIASSCFWIIDGWVAHWCTDVSWAMADTKPQSRQLTTQQHTQQPGTTLRIPSTLKSTLPQATPPRHRSTTPPRMLPQHITPKNLSTTLPRATEPRLRRSSITLPRPTTQRLLLRNTLNRNTTLRLQFATPQPSLHLATTAKPPGSTPKRSYIIQPSTLSQFTTPRNPSITVLQDITKLRLLNTTPGRFPSTIPLPTLFRPTTPKL